MKKSRGFTLIEVIIYIGLFSLLLGTAFVTAFQLIDGSNKLSAKNTTYEEANFVMRKIKWALTGASDFSNSTNTLHVNKYDGSKVYIELVGTKIKMTESSEVSGFITTDNVVVNSLQFTPTSNSGITATAKINDVDFTTTKYIRK